MYCIKLSIKRDYINVMSFNKIDLRRIIKLTTTEKLTFYDSSYIVIAEKLNITLAIKDRELRIR